MRYHKHFPSRPEPRHRPGRWPGAPHLDHRRRFLFWRIFRPLGFLFFLLLGFTGFLIAYTLLGEKQLSGQLWLLWLGGCGLVGLFPLLLFGLGARMYRDFGQPMAGLMSATEAIKGGDLSVRLPVDGPRHFQRLAEAFNEMTAELERSEQQRRNLTADVAHELRTPLHIIQGNLEGLLDDVYTPTPEHITGILEEIEQLKRLVDDLQTLSQAESGQLPIHAEEIDLHALLNGLAARFTPQANAAGIRLLVEGTTLLCQIDPLRLEQALGNLVSNALRHTPQGGLVTLRSRLAGEEISIAVSDTGEGISPEDLPYIFDRFWRGDRARSRATGGSGLGLAITRQLVRAQGGAIQVKSTPGEGTRFTITLLQTETQKTRS